MYSIDPVPTTDHHHDLAEHEHEDGHAHEDGHGHHGHGHDHRHGPLQALLGLFGGHSHDAADAVDDALEGSAEGIRAVKVGLVVLGLTAALQAALVGLTGSVALLADTVHNVADALTALPLWVAFALSGRAATRRYTYGFGRAEDLAGVFIVAMIVLSAVVAGWESVRRLLDPQPLSDPWVVMAAGVIGFVGNEAVAGYRVRVGRRIGSAALVADGVHARTDGFTSLAVVVGALGALAGWQWADPAVGVLITVAIVAMARGAARDIYRRLMDSVEPELVERAEAALATVPGVRRVHSLQLRWVGHRVRGEATVAVDDGLGVEQADAVAEAALTALRGAVPKLVSATVRPRPARSVLDVERA